MNPIGAVCNRAIPHVRGCKPRLPVRIVSNRAYLPVGIVSNRAYRWGFWHFRLSYRVTTHSSNEVTSHEMHFCRFRIRG